jgi:sortase A
MIRAYSKRIVTGVSLGQNEGIMKLRSALSANKLAWLLILISVACFTVSGIWYLRKSAPPTPRPAANGISAPSSVRPTPKEIETYAVAPDLPKFISIPTIGVRPARVMPLGPLKSNSIAAPANMHDAGWYNGSAKPGQDGAVFIYGHLSSWESKGLFYDLKKLKAGDNIIIARGDDVKFTYRVHSTKIYAHNAVDMNAVLTAATPGKQGLNLMTCSGHVIKGTSEFSERLVVFASLVTEYADQNPSNKNYSL